MSGTRRGAGYNLRTQEGAELKAYNDYIQATREYLRRYNEFKATLANLREELTEGEEELATPPAAGIARYGDEPGGGVPELNGVEAGAARLMLVSRRVEALRAEIARLERLLARVDRALDALPEAERNLVIEYYINRRTWADIAPEMDLSERWAQRRGFSALKKISEMLFGAAASLDEKRRFVFLETQ